MEEDEADEAISTTMQEIATVASLLRNDTHSIFIMPTHRVIQPYQSAYPDPIILKSGETLTISERQTDWPGWIWCTTASGESRWVPDVFIEPSPGQAVMRRDYNPVELSIQPGDLLTAEEIVNGWAWCSNAEGQHGWVPLECLQTVQEME